MYNVHKNERSRIQDAVASKKLLTLLLITYLVAVVAVRPSRSESKADGSRRSGENKEACTRQNPNLKIPVEQFRKVRQKVRSCKNLGFERNYRFISKSSERFLEIKPGKGRRVTANGVTFSSIYSLFTMTSYNCPDDSYIVRIKGVTRKHSLCFTETGKLIQKEDLRMSVKCAFYEKLIAKPGYEDHIQLVSAFNPNFVVAFNSRGRRLRGSNYTGLCNHLTKLEEGGDSRRDKWHSASMFEYETVESQDQGQQRESQSSLWSVGRPEGQPHTGSAEKSKNLQQEETGLNSSISSKRKDFKKRIRNSQRKNKRGRGRSSSKSNSSRSLDARKKQHRSISSRKRKSGRFNSRERKHRRVSSRERLNRLLNSELNSNRPIRHLKQKEQRGRMHVNIR
ncbi:hypothetical protein EGW08_000115 [Elysia chlorotica]|uniref:Fibroblast growth factor n=1 Tax=Elysia chlorotica TaxID=188477 RepID=A0A3S5K2K4_ELYCH|nr:hypothetical protein EGW08_000115 [Elysia chlorotica]